MTSFEHETNLPEQPQSAAITQDRSKEILGRTMFLVAATIGVCAFAAWAGKGLSFGWAIAFWIIGFAALIGLQFARKNHTLALTLLFVVGAALGLAIAPTVEAYAEAFGATVVAQAAGATALFVAGFGVWGYATRRDLAPMARYLFWALLALIAFGIVMIFVNIPGGYVIYSILGLVIFAGYTMYDFQRVRRATNPDDAVYLAASIFVDVLNIFLLILNLLGASR